MYLIIFLMLATFAVLVVGLVVMARGGKTSKAYSNKLMVLRVLMQASAVIVLALLFMSS